MTGVQTCALPILLGLFNLKKIAEGQEVELIGWGEEPFVCKLKRPSMLGLVANGDIPNPLLNAAR